MSEAWSCHVTVRDISITVFTLAFGKRICNEFHDIYRTYRRGDIFHGLTLLTLRDYVHQTEHGPDHNQDTALGVASEQDASRDTESLW